MPDLSLNELVEVLGSQLLTLLNISDTQPSVGIATDTRYLRQGEIFVALRGETFDGHCFVPIAQEKGAIAAIVDDAFIPDAAVSLPLMQVKDTLQAYQTIAQWWRERFEIPVIAVTGSVGKTTTKELLSAVLSTQGQVWKTQSNYNNEIGVPKTLLGLESRHDFAVIEMGMRGAGEIALLTQIARPTIAVITNVGTAHIERLGSREAIAQAKCELLAEMPRAGIAILNYDNPLLLETAARFWQGRVLTYGLTGGDLQGQVIDSEALGSQLLDVEGMQLPLPLPGQHNALNYLAALVVAKVLGLSWVPLQAGLRVDLPEGRSQRYKLPHDVVILDETYNAGLESMTAALHLLAQTPGQRRIAVLGAMKELGAHSLELHRQVGAVVRQLPIDELFVLVDDPDAEAIVAGAAPVAAVCCSTQVELLGRLRQVIQPGDRLLFKASHAIALDRIVKQLRIELGEMEPAECDRE